MILKGYAADCSSNKLVILKLQVTSSWTDKIVRNNKIIADTRLIIEVVVMFVLPL